MLVKIQGAKAVKKPMGERKGENEEHHNIIYRLPSDAFFEP